MPETMEESFLMILSEYLSEFYAEILARGRWLEVPSYDVN